MATFDRSLGPYLCECERGFKLTRNGACEDCTRIEKINAQVALRRGSDKPKYGAFGYSYTGPLTRGEVGAVLGMNVFGAGRE